MEEHKTTDAELVQAYLGGKEAALEELFARYRRPLYAYLNRMCGGDATAADDVFQEVWIRALRKLPQYEERGIFGAWLFQIAANQARGAYRRRRSWLKLFVRPEEGAMPEAAVESTAGVDLDRAVDEAVLERALLRLAPEQREVFLLRQNNLSFKEIAEIQRCPLNTALGRMHTAIKNLRNYCHDMQ